MSDFVCWFPIGLVGLLAANDVRIPGEVNVAMAMTVMPLNSTINPFLYTLNIVLERRRRAREQRLQDWMNKKVKAMVAEATGNKLTMHFTTTEASALIRQWLARGLVDVTDVSASPPVKTDNKENKLMPLA